MRIFYTASASPNSVDLPDSDLWQRNLLSGLQALGHDIVCFDYDLEPHFRHLDIGKADDREFIAAARPRLEAALIEQVTRAHETRPLDLFFSYFYSACVEPATVARIRQMGIPAVNFYCNAVHQFHLVSDIAPAYDYCMVPEEAALEKYRAIGARPVHVQMAANPEIYHPYDVPRQYDVTFVGQRYGDRAEYVGYLHDNGVNIRVWGPGWLTSQPAAPKGSRWHRRAQRLFSREGPAYLHRALRNMLAGGEHAGRMNRVALPPAIVGPALTDEELICMYSQSQISLGFSGVTMNHSGTDRNTHIRLRDFEVPMSGALYMVEYQRELSRYYDIGREIVCYESKQDLLAKIRYYLGHPEEAERIRQAGRARALHDHTWQRRFAGFFAEIGMAG